MRLAILLSNFIMVCLAIYVSESEKNPALVRAVRGREARLPCGQGKLFLDGPGSYIIWLKNDREFRYRFPNPSAEKRLATRDYIFTIPCESAFCRDETSLVIKNVTDRDEGLYRCRIHYQASPSVDVLVDVKVVESTGMPKIYTGDGEPLNKGFVGPLSLGTDLTLVCKVDADDLNTQISWHRNGAVVEGAFASRDGRILRVDTHLRKLSRGDLNAHYECFVQNADVTEPLMASVYIKMYLPPMSVEIRMNKNYDFEAGQPRVVDCVVVGCIPPPAITWHIGPKMVRPSVHKELNDGNYTVSSLTLALSLRDHRNELVCSAHNAHMPTKVFQDKVTINVGNRPICQNGREHRIGAVAGEPETVKCVVDAYPEPVQFSWTFVDSKTLYTSFTKVDGYPNRYTSTLTWQSRDADIGLLLCRATNAFGEQKKPCIYRISPGGPPEAPKCNVRRIYPNSLRVQCVKGWDGGRPQMVHLNIVDEYGTRIKNVSESSGHFYLPNIVDQVNLTAVLYASNPRGKSAERVIYLHTLPAISEADSNYIQSEWMPYIEAFTGIVALAIAATIITLGARLLLARSDGDEISLDIVPLPDGCYHREPDFVRDERRIGNTNITVNQLAPCQNQYTSSPLPTCRLVHGPLPRHDACPASQHSYYV